MNKEEYRSLLGQLPLKSPTVHDMAWLCPHLTPSQAVEAFRTKPGAVACPPLRVGDGFHILRFCDEWIDEIRVREKGEGGKEVWRVTERKNKPAMLWHWGAGRIQVPIPWKDDGCAYKAEAIAFAQTNWGKELIQGTWNDVERFVIQDPTDLVEDFHLKGYPRTKAVLHVALSRDSKDIHRTDESKPMSKLFDDAICEMTLDHLIADELTAGIGPACTNNNCAHCGAGLSLSECNGCHHEFRDDYSHCGWDTPLSPKMVTFLRENGYEFKIDPKIAQRREGLLFVDYRRRWSK